MIAKSVLMRPGTRAPTCHPLATRLIFPFTAKRIFFYFTFHDRSNIQGRIWKAWNRSWHLPKSTLYIFFYV